MADLSPEAKGRAARTIQAAAVFAEYAEQIAVAVEAVPDKHVLVAVVDTDYQFRGTYQVGEAELIDRVKELEGDGWAMVFSPGAHPGHIRGRTSEMASIAQKRIEMIDRISARRAASP
jgi:hypothetical protein